MNFDGAVNGGNYLFGESVSLIDFTKVRTVFEFCLFFPPCSDWQFLTAHRLVPLCLALKWPPAFEFIFQFKFNSDLLKPQRKLYFFVQILSFVHVFPPFSGWQLLCLGLVHNKDFLKP